MQNGCKCYWIKKQIEPFHTDPTIDKKYIKDVNKWGYKIWLKWTEAYNHIRFKSKGLSALVNVWGLEISSCSFIFFICSLNTVSLDCIKFKKLLFFVCLFFSVWHLKSMRILSFHLLLKENIYNIHSFTLKLYQQVLWNL